MTSCNSNYDFTETVFLYVCVINLSQAREIFNVFHACHSFF